MYGDLPMTLFVYLVWLFYFFLSFLSVIVITSQKKMFVLSQLYTKINVYDLNSQFWLITSPLPDVGRHRIVLQKKKTITVDSLFN